ncbi:glycosyl hydrolase [Actinoplanes sp. NPDC051851]|uniref:glycosyl hydrolase n=1 Tax=Actinoplanes sp. NPDC051851 TaxID=3154753 RepID=UPI003412535C
MADASPIPSRMSAAAPTHSVAPAVTASAPASLSASASASASPSESSASPAPTETIPAMPAVAPYLDITADADVKEIHKKTGLTDFTLAFVLADSSGECTPTWGGTTALNNSTVQARIDKIDAFGGDVIVSTGGADGTYLESVCSQKQLVAAYKKALDAAGSNHLDVDIEQDVDNDTVIGALAALQEDRNTAVTLTVPADGSAVGLTDESIALLEDAKAGGVEVTVNAMTMNFDDAGEDWATAITETTQAVHDDMAAIWSGRSDARISAMLGITPMIGVNDSGGVTTVANARTVVSYAEKSGLGFVRFWSLNRDNGDCDDGELSGACSGVDQSDYAFTKLFTDFE